MQSGMRGGVANDDLPCILILLFQILPEHHMLWEMGMVVKKKIYKRELLPL